MQALTPRRGIGLSFVLLFATALPIFAGAALEVRTYLDTDNNPATGCQVVTAAGLVSGMDQVLVATVDTSVNPHVVTGLVKQECVGGAFLTPIPVASPYPSPWGVGDRNGADAADVVEMYIPRFALANVYTMRLAFTTSEAGQADALLSTGGGPGDPPIRFQLAEPIPALSGAAIAALGVLVAIVGVLLGRRSGAAALVLALLVAVAGVAWAAVVLDGDPCDWQPGACCAHDALGDAPPGVDIAAAHVSADDDLVYLRVDAGRNATPAAVDDAVSTDKDTLLNCNVLTANPTTPDGDADLDTLTVTGVNGSAGAVGVATALPSGAVLTVQAGGSFAYDPNGVFASLCPGASATDSFTYTVSDGHGGSSGATVTVTITGAEHAAIDVEKLVNGCDADDAPGPTLELGQAVLWSYLTTNTGAVRLSQITVADDRGVAVTCPKTTLQPGESMTCTGSGHAIAAQYHNIGTATGTTPCGATVSDADTAYYLCTGHPSIAVVKSVNGDDADTPPGLNVIAGAPVIWTYAVTNAGDVRLRQVTVTDDQGVAVSCPKTTLEPTESMTCTGSGTAIAGQYHNTGTATGTPPVGTVVTGQNAAYYYGLAPRIAIRKMVNGQDANTPPGPSILIGSTVSWTYTVTDTGDVTVTQVSVIDDRGVAVTCPKTVLAAGETMTCTASGTAVAGQYHNIGTATGTPPAGSPVTAADPAYYFGAPPGQGCTPGAWRNHTGWWPWTGYSTSQHLDSVFASMSYFPSLASSTLLQAVSFDGGPDLDGIAEILLRGGVAALLNAAHPNINYPRTPASVIADVNTALASGSVDSMLVLAAALDADNNLGCPLL
jgi:VCBS repeat-containing protein